MSYLAKAKAALSHVYDPAFCEHGTAATLGLEPSDETRRALMRLMTDWGERAAMMTCGDLTVEQAELAAWHDLELDRVFWGAKVLH